MLARGEDELAGARGIEAGNVGQVVDRLVGEITDLDPERAGALILAARKHWFEQGQQA